MPTDENLGPIPEQYLEDKLTPCSVEDMYEAVVTCLTLGLPPAMTIGQSSTQESAEVILAHWALETGWGKFCHWYNIGNKKHVTGDGHDYTMFRCNEVIGGKTVWFDPPNPATWFVAYDSLEAGVLDYMLGIHKHWGAAWPAILQGDPEDFCHLLKLSHYYTADEAQYTKTFLACFEEIKAKISDPDVVPESFQGPMVV